MKMYGEKEGAFREARVKGRIVWCPFCDFSHQVDNALVCLNCGALFSFAVIPSDSYITEGLEALTTTAANHVSIDAIFPGHTTETLELKADFDAVDPPPAKPKSKKRKGRRG